MMMLLPLLDSQHRGGRQAASLPHMLEHPRTDLRHNHLSLWLSVGLVQVDFPPGRHL